MTIAERIGGHDARLASIEAENKHCGEKHVETAQAIKSLSDKFDKGLWALVGILGAVIAQLVVALVKK